MEPMLDPRHHFSLSQFSSLPFSASPSSYAATSLAGFTVRQSRSSASLHRIATSNISSANASRMNTPTHSRRMSIETKTEDEEEENPFLFISSSTTANTAAAETLSPTASASNTVTSSSISSSATKNTPPFPPPLLRTAEDFSHPFIELLRSHQADTSSHAAIGTADRLHQSTTSAPSSASNESSTSSSSSSSLSSSSSSCSSSSSMAFHTFSPIMSPVDAVRRLSSNPSSSPPMSPATICRQLLTPSPKPTSMSSFPSAAMSPLQTPMSSASSNLLAGNMLPNNSSQLAPSQLTRSCTAEAKEAAAALLSKTSDVTAPKGKKRKAPDTLAPIPPPNTPILPATPVAASHTLMLPSTNGMHATAPVATAAAGAEHGLTSSTDCSPNPSPSPRLLSPAGTPTGSPLVSPRHHSGSPDQSFRRLSVHLPAPAALPAQTSSASALTQAMSLSALQSLAASACLTSSSSAAATAHVSRSSLAAVDENFEMNGGGEFDHDAADSFKSSPALRPLSNSISLNSTSSRSRSNSDSSDVNRSMLSSPFNTSANHFLHSLSSSSSLCTSSSATSASFYSPQQHSPLQLISSSHSAQRQISSHAQRQPFHSAQRIGVTDKTQLSSCSANFSEVRDRDDGNTKRRRKEDSAKSSEFLQNSCTNEMHCGHGDEIALSLAVDAQQINGDGTSSLTMGMRNRRMNDFDDKHFAAHAQPMVSNLSGSGSLSARPFHTRSLHLNSMHGLHAQQPLSLSHR